MSVRDQQIEDELKNISVTKDAFELWLQNDVTRMFRLMVERDYQEGTQRVLIGSTIEQIAMDEIVRSASVTVLQKILEWSPDFGDEE